MIGLGAVRGFFSHGGAESTEFFWGHCPGFWEPQRTQRAQRFFGGALLGFI
jgi:hypothetical protein